MFKILSLFLVGSLSVGVAYAQISDKQMDQVIDLLMDDNDVSDHMFGDDGEECFSDIDVDFIEQLENKEWTIDFDILHLEKHGCVYWTSINCEAKLSEDLSKVLEASCSY
jgi:hypothetical protein